MHAHPIIVRDYMNARLDESLRQAESAAAAHETRMRVRPWPWRWTPPGLRPGWMAVNHRVAEVHRHDL